MSQQEKRACAKAVIVIQFCMQPFTFLYNHFYLLRGPDKEMHSKVLYYLSNEIISSLKACWSLRYPDRECLSKDISEIPSHHNLFKNTTKTNKKGKLYYIITFRIITFGILIVSFTKQKLMLL